MLTECMSEWSNNLGLNICLCLFISVVATPVLLAYPFISHPIHEDVSKLRLCVYSLQQLASTGLCRAVFSKLRLLPQNRSGKSPLEKRVSQKRSTKLFFKNIIVKKWARPSRSSGYPEGKYQKYIHFIQKWHTDTHRHTLTQKHTDTHTHQPSSHLNVCTSQVHHTPKPNLKASRLESYNRGL